MSLKVRLTCKHCSKIFKQPISLPCGHTLCQEHLDQTNPIEFNNSIKCISCFKEFKIDSHNFAPNYVVGELINNDLYLSDEERSLRTEIQESIIKLSQLNQIFESIRDTFRNFDLEVHEHFQEIRRQIDLHREHEHYNQTRNKIDKIALDMIEKTKKFEGAYFKSLNKILEKCLLFQLNVVNVEDETEKLNEIYRDPWLSFDSIKRMNQEINIAYLTTQTCLAQMEEVRKQLHTNRFLPNNESFDQPDVFGILKLNKYSTDLQKSSILNEQQSIDLIKLCEFSFDAKFELVYRGSMHGFDAANFHSKCDGHANTLTLIKACETLFIFGAFTSATWDSSNQWKSDPNAFLFSLTNNDNKPCKMKIEENQHQNAIYCHSKCGPIFGLGDIRIDSNANRKKSCWSDLGSIFKHSQYAFGTTEAKKFLAGSEIFQIIEIELYTVD